MKKTITFTSDTTKQELFEMLQELEATIKDGMTQEKERRDLLYSLAVSTVYNVLKDCIGALYGSSIAEQQESQERGNLIDFMQRTVERACADNITCELRLTPRQAQALHMQMLGYSYGKIAACLDITPRAAAGIIQTIYKRLAAYLSEPQDTPTKK